MKRSFLVLVLAAFVAGGVFAQERTAAGTKFWLQGEVSIVGGGGRIEYMITDNLSVGFNAYTTMTIIFALGDTGAIAVARYYPWAGIFYAGLGLGFQKHRNGEPLTTGFGIVPEIGWKMDVGSPGGFYINPLVQIPITIGKITSSYSGEDLGSETILGIRLAIGLGYTF